MTTYWKQLEEWGTGLKANLFTWARLKLTFWYLVIIGGILTMFSFVLYTALSQSIRENAEGDFSDDRHRSHEAFILKTTDALRSDIMLADISIMFLAAACGYFLAGKTLKPIQKALEAQKQFNANASHELRTPLTIIKTDSEVSLRNNAYTSEQYKRLLSSNLEEVDRMSAIVEDLLILSRGKKDKTRQTLSQIDLSLIANAAVEKMQRISQSKDITLTMSAKGKAMMRGDAHALQRMLFNLIQNALTYTPAGGTIHLEVCHIHKQIELIVEDTGIGIEKNDLAHIFEPFYKADKARALNSAGAGLGLAIVKEIVNAHKGTIRIKSKPGKGTKVIIVFPA